MSSDIFTPDNGADGVFVRVRFNVGTHQEVTLGMETPDYKTAKAGQLYLFQGSVTSFPNLNIKTRQEATQDDDQLMSMKCQLQ